MRVRFPLAAQKTNTIGPIGEFGRPRHPVTVENTGSNPVGTAHNKKMKLSALQLDVLERLKRELSYWESSNDLGSPSHSTSMETDMFSGLGTEHTLAEELEPIEEIMQELRIAILKLQTHK